MDTTARASRQRPCRLSPLSIVSTAQFFARVVSLLVLTAMLVSPVALLAQAGGGTIEGRVRNVGNDRYLNRARVVIEGTTRETFTNEFGEYRFTDVPAGEVRVRVNYTGLDAEAVPVTVTAGGTVQQNFDLTSKDRYGDDKTITLSEFVVQSNREYEGNALATNEQRYAPNVKVVVAADAFGDISEGNPGEFLKYLPGLSVDYVAADVRTVSVRGFASNFTNVSWDGMRLTSSASGSNNRIFEFEQVSINNTSRTEVTKVPTPDTPADSLGGSINFISKNAFERKGAQFNYRAYMNMNSENTKLFSKTPGPGNEKTYKVLPNFDFDYTLPVNDRFGLVITGLSSNQHVEQHRWQPTWNYAQAGATPANPYLQQWQLQDGPKTTNRASIGIKADWKVTDRQTLSVAVQNNYYKTFFGNRNLNFNVGTNAVPTPATGTALLWGPTFVQSATGRATVTQGSSFRDKLGNTAAANLRYNWNNGDWNVDAGANTVVSKTWYRALARDHFANIGTQLQGVSIVRADNIDFPSLTWVARDAAGAVVDPYNLANYRVTTATNDPVDGKATVQSAYVDALRHFDSWTVPISVKVGLNVREEGRDNRRYSETYTYLGPNGIAADADNVATQFLDSSYSGSNPGFGSPAIQWVDAYKLAALYKSNPSQFRLGTGTNQDGVEAETNRINNSEKITERISSAYIQFDGKLMDSKLRFVTGVRFEKTQDKGEGALSNPDAVFQRNANGSYVDGDPVAAGIQRVRRADAGTAGSLQELKLIRVERGYKADREYDGFYPSLHLTYNFTDNFLARFAYAKTIGRPDYANIIPNADINEDDTNPDAPGSITIRNTALQPWTADNFDLSLEYYFAKGGLFSVGAFEKKLSDFWTNRGGTLDAALASELGLESRYVGWTVSTLVNGGDASISGAEFNLVQPLAFLPGFGKYLTIKSNGTMIHLSGDNTPDFRGFISKTGNFSISYNRSPIVLNVNFNYRGRQKGTTITAPAAQTGAQYGTTTGFFEYYEPRYNIDLSAEYKLSKRFNIFAGARNILNKEQVIQRFSADSARYAAGFRHEEFGVNYSLGVKGRF
ncbi:MAG: TonB-dependent receptor [Opitutaceae bacterium]